MDIASKPSVGVLIIDAQNDFCENRGQTGSLYIKGSTEDMQRGAQFIKTNKDLIKKIYASFDVHSRMQIFHQAWWIETATGENPEPYTLITLKDIDNGVFIANIEQDWSREYVRLLEEQGEFMHLIWPYHCIQGTWGSLMHTSVAKAIEDWQVNYGSAITLETLNKGWAPGYEYFGIFKPQFNLKETLTLGLTRSLLRSLTNTTCFMFRRAESHCVGLSIKQLLDEANKSLSVASSLLGKMFYYLTA